MDVWFDDLTIGHSVTAPPAALTREAIIRFAAEFDPQPFHLDEAAARDSFFGALVASGAHSFAFTMRRGVDAGVFTGHAVAGLGVDDIRFLKPIPPDLPLTARFTVTALRPSTSKPGLGIVHWASLLLGPDGTPFFSAVIKNLMRRRPAPEADARPDPHTGT